MIISRDKSYAALAKLKPAPVFLQSYQSKRLPEDLNIYFGPPEELFLAPATDEEYPWGDRIPILDDGNFGLLLFVDPGTKKLAQIDIECPDEIHDEYENWQQYLAELMIRIGEGIDDDKRVRRAAKVIAFAHVDGLFDFFSRTQALSGRAYKKAKRQFLASLH